MAKGLKKGIASVVVVMFALSLILVGCGKTNQEPVASAPASADASAQPSAQTGEKTVLNFWSWATDSDTIKKVLEDAIANFNKSNTFNVEIKSSYTPGEQYKTKLQTEMAANNAPDILYMWAAGKMKPYVDADRLYPISDLMDKDQAWKDRYVDGVFDLTTFNNKVYGIPSFRTACMVYYNTEMFKQFNLEAPKTWSELLNVVKVLKQNGKDAFALDAKEPWVAAMYAEYIADRIDPEAYKTVQKDNNWTVPTYIEAGKKIKELKDAGAFPKGATSLDYVAARNLFDQGKAGMYIMGSWDVGYLSGKDYPLKDKVGVFKFPTIDGGKGDANNWLAGVEAVIAVSAKCKNPEAAGGFLKYLSEPEIAKDKIAEEAGYVPVVKVEPDPTKVSKLYTDVNNILKDKKATFAFYDVNLGSVIGDEFNNAIQAIIVGKSPEEAFKKVDQVAKAEAAKAGSGN